MGRFGGNRHGRHYLERNKKISNIIVFQLL